MMSKCISLFQTLNVDKYVPIYMNAKNGHVYVISTKKVIERHGLRFLPNPTT